MGIYLDELPQYPDDTPYTFVHTINTVACSRIFSAKKMVIYSPISAVIVACIVAAAVGCHV